MNIKGVLVELENDGGEVSACSGTQIDDDFVLITSHIFPDQLCPETFQPCTAPTGRITVVSKGGDNKTSYTEAKLFASFASPTIARSTSSYLSDWSLDDVALDKFFVLSLRDADIQRVKEKLRQLHSSRSVCGVGDPVYVRSAPFGERKFVSSYSEGVLSNVIGDDDCLLLTDCPTVFGSEGSPVFCKQSATPIGIVLSSVNTWKGDWLGITLVASFKSILRQFADLCDPERSNFVPSKRDSLTRSVVALRTDSGWGTGIMLDLQKGLFLTNFHVIENSDKVEVVRDGISIPTRSVYVDKALDLAVVKCDGAELRTLGLSPARICREKITVGQKVYAVGHPIFPPHLNVRPTVTSGHVSCTDDSSLTTTCSVFSGNSGGALLSETGLLIGVVTGNARDELTDVVFPRVNLSVPVRAFPKKLTEILDGCDSYKGDFKRHLVTSKL